MRLHDWPQPQRIEDFSNASVALIVAGTLKLTPPSSHRKFRAEYSAIKSVEVNYGEPGSIRMDVLERVDKSTACVYDIMVGDRGLSGPRAAEIALNVQRLYPGTQRVIVIETRPR